ncbi:hypothetical protein B0H10DRAFT_575675 [Mycena sp. CBHHK59/15]|nr:hypothetical protein B0H10DRAFT_575675 [Mycena sp. CBHHK59/15]
MVVGSVETGNARCCAKLHPRYLPHASLSLSPLIEPPLRDVRTALARSHSFTFGTSHQRPVHIFDRPSTEPLLRARLPLCTAFAATSAVSLRHIFTRVPQSRAAVTTLPRRAHSPIPPSAPVRRRTSPCVCIADWADRCPRLPAIEVSPHATLDSFDRPCTDQWGTLPASEMVSSVSWHVRTHLFRQGFEPSNGSLIAGVSLRNGEHERGCRRDCPGRPLAAPRVRRAPSPSFPSLATLSSHSSFHRVAFCFRRQMSGWGYPMRTCVMSRKRLQVWFR